MEKLTVREYATKHKLSTFNVVKMTRNGELKIEKITENGQEIVLILIDDTVEQAAPEKIETKRESRNLRAENMSLKKEIVKLKEELAICKKSQERN